MVLPSWPALATFMALMLALSLYGLTVSGHFPSERRGPRLRDMPGAVVLWGTLALMTAILLIALAFAYRTLPTYAAIIGGGFMVLIAPLMLQPCPDSFVNGRRGLLTFTIAGAILAALAMRIG